MRFEKRGQPRASRLDLPVMARIVRVRPADPYEAKECVRNKFSRMLIQILANLRPGKELDADGRPMLNRNNTKE
jgi:hypothetical protein